MSKATIGILELAAGQPRTWRALMIEGGWCDKLDCRRDHDLLDILPKCHRSHSRILLDRNRPRIVVVCGKCSAELAVFDLATAR